MKSRDRFVAQAKPRQMLGGRLASLEAVAARGFPWVLVTDQKGKATLADCNQIDLPHCMGDLLRSSYRAALPASIADLLAGKDLKRPDTPALTLAVCDIDYEKFPRWQPAPPNARKRRIIDRISSEVVRLLEADVEVLDSRLTKFNLLDLDVTAGILVKSPGKNRTWRLHRFALSAEQEPDVWLFRVDSANEPNELSDDWIPLQIPYRRKH